MKCIIFIDNISSQGGSQTFCKHIAEVFLNLGKDVDICTILKQKDNVPKNCFSLGLNRNYEIIFHLKKIKNIISHYDFVLVISGQIFQYIHFVLDKNKTVFRESNDPYFRNSKLSYPKKLFINILYEIFLSRNNFLIIQNEEAFQKIKLKHKNLTNTHLISNPCFEPYKKIVKPFTQRKYMVASLSRDTWAKGNDRHETIYRSIKEKFLVLGNINEKSKINIANITYISDVDEVRPFLENSRFLLLLSRIEGFPNVVHEAIQAGCYIIVSQELSWIKKEFSEFGEIIKIFKFERNNDIGSQFREMIKEIDRPISSMIRSNIKKKYDPNVYVKRVCELNA